MSSDASTPLPISNPPVPAPSSDEVDAMAVDDTLVGEQRMPDLLDPSDSSDESDEDNDNSSAAIHSSESSALAANRAPPATTHADRLQDRRPRMDEVVDDDDRARRTPTPRHIPTPTPDQAEGSSRPIRPLPRAFGASRQSIPLAGSYVHHGVSFAAPQPAGADASGAGAAPAPRSAPSPASQPANTTQGQQQDQQGPPAWLAAILRSIIASSTSGAEPATGPNTGRHTPNSTGSTVNVGTPTQTQPVPLAENGADPAAAQPHVHAHPFPLPQEFFSMFDAQPKDDPGQARRLIEGLEEIPSGLLKRYMRVEQANGEGTGACAVCFEALDVGLDGEGTPDWKAGAAPEAATSPPAAAASDAPQQVAEAAAGQSASDPPVPPLRPRALVLPCGHVFHSTCLEPWFLQHTTCPNCRFNLDPHGLASTAHVEGRRPMSNFGQLPPELATEFLAALFGSLGAPAPADPNAPPTAQPHAAAPQQPQDAAHQSPQPAQQPAQPPRVPPPAAGPFAELLARLNARPSPHQVPNLFGLPIPQQPPAFGPSPPPGQQQQQGSAPSGGTDIISIHLDIGLHFGPPASPPTPNQQPPAQARTMAFDFIFGAPAGQAHPGGAPAPQNGTPTPATAAGGAPGPLPPFMHGFTFGFPLGGVAPAPHRHAQPQRPPPSRKWSRPEAQGRTLRQIIEKRERELGLRCDAISCDVAPEDEYPTPELPEGVKLRTVHLHGTSKPCNHAFHPQCIVSSARVACPFGQTPRPDVVACPVCRAEGSVDVADWDEGVRIAELEVQP